jgi:ectoine hydroxylase-related dioxygenase (phytanoyl-CoA dioxygenase family)
MWFPLQHVTEQNSCLQVAPGLHRGRLHENYEDPTSGFVGVSPAVQQRLTGRSIEMDPGDVLCFTQETPHRAVSNRSDAVRWSMDLRYEATPTATASGRPQGFIARSQTDPQTVETYEQWLRKWAAIPPGSY